MFRKACILAAALTSVCIQALFCVPAYAKAKTDYTLYADFMAQDEFVYKMKKKDDSGNSRCGLTFFDTYGTARYERKMLHFCLLDLNGDGVKELIVARMGSNWTPKAMTLYVFTIRNNKVKFVKYGGSNDYTFRAIGDKLYYSEKNKALYCQALIQESSAYYDDETMTFSLYKMKGKKIVRTAYAAFHKKVGLTGKKKSLREYCIRKAGAAKCSSDEYDAYMEKTFQHMDLKVVRLYANTAANKKKLLGKSS